MCGADSCVLLHSPKSATLSSGISGDMPAACSSRLAGLMSLGWAKSTLPVEAVS